MKTIKKHLRLSVFLCLVGALFSTSSLNAASGDKTAAYYRAHADKYVNSGVNVDVAFVRAIPKGSEADHSLRILAVTTVDEDERAPGGAIMCVVDESEYESLVKRYGTNIERKGRSVNTKNLRATLRIVDSHRDIIYLDTTDGSKTTDPKVIASIVQHTQAERGASGRRGKMH